VVKSNTEQAISHTKKQNKKYRTSIDFGESPGLQRDFFIVTKSSEILNCHKFRTETTAEKDQWIFYIKTLLARQRLHQNQNEFSSNLKSPKVNPTS
jgi:hypothetical protein